MVPSISYLPALSKFRINLSFKPSDDDTFLILSTNGLAHWLILISTVRAETGPTTNVHSISTNNVFLVILIAFSLFLQK